MKGSEADEFSIEHTAPIRLSYIIITLTLGWPMYLVANVSGRPYDRWANHFDPYSPIFSKRERLEVSKLHAFRLHMHLSMFPSAHVLC